MRKQALIKTKHWIITLLFLLPLFPFAALAAPVGKISNLVGNVDITVTGKTARMAAPGEPVTIGDFIRTKSKSKAEITFNEGNILKLAENTRVRITQYMSGEKQNSSIFNLFRGRIQNIVKSVGIGGRYEVHTPTAVCGVRGTLFFVGHEAGKTDVAVLDGTVVATSSLPPDTPGGTPKPVELILNAGQGAIFDGITPPKVVTISSQQFNEMKNATDISVPFGYFGGIVGSAPPPPSPLLPLPHLAATFYNVPPLIVPPPVQPVQQVQPIQPSPPSAPNPPPVLY